MNLHHQNILNNLASGIIAINIENKITVFNHSAEKILNFKSEEILGKHVRALSANMADLLLDTLHRDKSYHRKKLYILPDRTLIGLSTSKIYDLNSALLGASMVFNSLSDSKKEKNILRQDIDAYWLNIANSMAHGIKNSLVATKVLMEMFLKKHQDSEYRKQLYSVINRDVQKLDNFSEGLLSFAQNRQLIVQPCRIDEILNAAVLDSFKHHPAKEITVEKCYTQVPSVPGDYHQLKEAFSAIIENAIEATDKQGKLRISIEQKGKVDITKISDAGFSGIANNRQLTRQLPTASSILIKITDTGCGIPPQNLPYLFNPFFTTKEGKRGLGLAITQKIIEKHQGHISIESKTGEGTAVLIHLPVLAELN
ncbi:MAG: ATP-binding protein [Candidatus Omnitrophota bacterium]